MQLSETILIDRSKCTGCGRCVEICPLSALSMDDGKAAATGDRTLLCGHCAAVCPADAIRVVGVEDPVFETFAGEGRWMAPGSYDMVGLAQLMRSRRSCRHFTAQPVDRRQLDDLVKLGVSAPSGTNSQRWTFTLFPARASVERLGKEVGCFFERLNRMARRGWLRTGLKWIGQGDLDRYYRRHYPTIESALTAWRQEGRDRLFHGATAVIVVGSEPEASTPADDALLATQNILLAAHAMGLGTCLIGFAVAAMRKDPTIQGRLEIPTEETIHSVIALGHPAVGFERAAGRRPPTTRVVPS